jgi:hypothetical protein
MKAKIEQNLFFGLPFEPIHAALAFGEHIYASNRYINSPP